jgi:hypothetical protein
MKNKGIFIAGIGLLSVMALLFFYANSSHVLYLGDSELNKSKDLKGKEKILTTQLDTNQINTNITDTIVEEISNYDTSNKKILLFGDSQAEGIMDPLYNYTLASRHDLLFALPWYSASDRTFASNDTLKNIINQVKPDYIIVVLGLNQIFQSNLEPSRKAVQSILNTIGDIPFSWIGPANWVEDKGINSLYEEVLPKGSFFLSKNLNLPRGPDGRHPNGPGYKIWMDSIASWLNTKAKWKINMVKPAKTVYTRGFKLLTLNAGRRAIKNSTTVDSVNMETKIDSIQN